MIRGNRTTIWDNAAIFHLLPAAPSYSIRIDRAVMYQYRGSVIAW